MMQLISKAWIGIRCDTGGPPGGCVCGCDVAAALRQPAVSVQAPFGDHRSVTCSRCEKLHYITSLNAISWVSPHFLSSDRALLRRPFRHVEVHCDPRAPTQRLRHELRWAPVARPL